jgi:DNA-binding MarR family transcriptional regulator
MNDNYMELYEKLRRLQWLVQKQRMTEATDNNPFNDTTRGQGRVLALLKIQPQISTKDLTYLLGIRQQSINELLNKLEKGGYVERKPSEGDKRIMIVHLTEKGRTVQQQERKFPNIFASLSLEEQKNFGEYLDRIIKALEEELEIEPNAMEEWYKKARAMGEEREGLFTERPDFSANAEECRPNGRRSLYGDSPFDGRFMR